MKEDFRDDESLDELKNDWSDLKDDFGNDKPLDLIFN
jgi:hypothetical protein